MDEGGLETLHVPYSLNSFEGGYMENYDSEFDLEEYCRPPLRA